MTLLRTLLNVGLWDRLRAVLKREQREVDDALADFEERANRTLDARERELRATPEERLEIQQERVSEAEDAFEEVRRRIEGGSGAP